MKSGLFQKYEKSPSLLTVIGAIVGAGFLTAALHCFNIDWIGLPLFLDMIGTFVITLFFGLVPGFLTAFATHGFIEILHNFPGSMAWIHISILSALLLWLLIRHHQFENLMHAILAIVYITLLNAILGAITATFFYSGITDHPVDNLVTGFLSIGHTLLSSTFWARIPINLIDKGIAVFITFGLKKLYIYRETQY